MRIKNNNQKVLKELAKGSYKANKLRNRLLIGTIGAAIAILFCIVSVSKGQIKTEYLSITRSSGNIISAYLDRPTNYQYEKIKTLDYIEAVGKESIVGAGMRSGNDVFSMSVVDEVAFNEMYKPAYDNLVGEYPVRENEVMLPVAMIDRFGGEKKIGSSIQLEIQTDDQGSRLEEFIISGYFDEYIDEHLSTPSAYFSEKYLDSFGKSLSQPDYLIMQQIESMSSEEVSEKLYKDVATIDDLQTFDTSSAKSYRVIEDIYGDYTTMYLLGSLVLLCICLLIVNVMRISLENTMKDIGLLRTIGTTKRQNVVILSKQAIHIIIIGVIVGSIVSFGLLKIVLPLLLGNLVTNQGVRVADVLEFNVPILIMIIIICVIVAFVAILVPMLYVSKISPREALNYSSSSNKKGKKIISSKKAPSIQKMAFRSITQSKRKLVRICLTICVVSILSVIALMIVKDKDNSNWLQDEPDFVVDEMILPNYYEMPQDFILDDNTVKNLNEIDNIKEVDYTFQSYVRLDKEESIFEPLQKAAQGNDDELDVPMYTSGIQVVRNEEMDEFEHYLKKKDPQVDFQKFKDGNIFFISQTFLSASKTIKEEMKNTGAKDITIYDLYNEPKGEFTFGGYLEQKKGFPDIRDGSTNSSYTPYLLMSETMFHKLAVEKSINKISITIESGKNEYVRKEIHNILEKRMDQFKQSNNQMVGIIDKEQNEKDEYAKIRSMKILYYGIIVMLMLIAVMNYFNVVYASILERRKELSTLECIGMTRQQLRKQLIYEGIYYWLITTGILLSIGSLCLYLTNRYIQRQRYEIVFEYPTFIVMAIILIVLIISVILPLLIYQKVVKKSIVERMNT